MSILSKQLADAQARLVEIGDDMEAIGQVAVAENRDLSEDDNNRIGDLSAEADRLEKQIGNLKNAVAARDKITASRITPELLQAQDRQLPGVSSPQAALPAKVKRTRSKYYESNYEAYCVGQWLGAVVMNRPDCVRFCREHGVGEFRGAMSEGTTTAGGFTVPDPMAATIIELVEQWGVFRANARNVVMTSDTLDVPKWSAGATVYYPAENAAITPSDLTFAQVNLQAVKYAQLSLMSTELAEDSVISVVDLVTRDFARNFAYSEDLNSFLGDGTGTYGSITGIANALAAGAIVTGAGNTFGELTLANFYEMMAKLKQYPGIQPKWYIHSYGYFQSMVPLLIALGGTDIRQAEAGTMMTFLGYPVVFTQVLPGDQAGNSDFVCVFGDLDLGAYLGTRRQVTIRTLNELYAASDQIGVVGTMRSDSVIHSVGDANEAGAIVGMQLAAA